MKNILIAIVSLMIVTACTSANQSLKTAANDAKKGDCDIEKLGSLLSITSQNVGSPIPKNIRFVGKGAGKIKGKHKNIPKKGRITLGVNNKGQVVSAYCG